MEQDRPAASCRSATRERLGQSSRVEINLAPILAQIRKAAVPLGPLPHSVERALELLTVANRLRRVDWLSTHRADLLTQGVSS